MVVTQKSIEKLENIENRVNCWNDLKPFCHNVVGNDKREGKKVKGYMVNQQPSS